MQRRDEYHVTRKVQDLKVNATRRRGRPELRWTGVIKKDLKDLDLKPADAADRKLWRSRTHFADPKDWGQTRILPFLAASADKKCGFKKKSDQNMVTNRPYTARILTSLAPFKN